MNSFTRNMGCGFMMGGIANFFLVGLVAIDGFLSVAAGIQFWFFLVGLTLFHSRKFIGKCFIL